MEKVEAPARGGLEGVKVAKNLCAQNFSLQAFVSKILRFRLRTGFLYCPARTISLAEKEVA